MTQLEKYKYAIQILKELNCPEDIMTALYFWGEFVRLDDIKLKNWQSLCEGGLIEGEFKCL